MCIRDRYDHIQREKLNFGLKNSLGGGARVDIDEFLNGRIVIKKNYEFRHDQNVEDNITMPFDWYSPISVPGTDVKRGVNVTGKSFKLAKNMAKLFDVSNDTWPETNSGAISTLVSVMTMGAARQLLHPVQGPEQSSASAMNTAPTMPYKIQFDVPEKIMNILQGIEDKPKDDSDLGSAGEIGGVDATAAATAAAERRKKKNNKVNESKLFERLKKRPFFNQDDIKPEFPENPPPKLDPKTGMHPQYGKKAGRYKKLDPISANSMPPTGDPEIDAVVNKQKTINKIKRMAKNKQ